jgi:hypothetical protein
MEGGEVGSTGGDPSSLAGVGEFLEHFADIEKVSE